MAEDRSLPYGFPLPPSWLAALQEFIGTAAPNFHLSLANDHTVQVVATANSGQVGVGIDALFRYRSTTVTAAVTGAAGLFDIFAVCGPNDFVSNPSPPPPELDSTVYDFAVQVLAHGTTPTITGSVTNFRLVGQLDWDGSHITGFRPLVGETRATDPLTPTAPAATAEAIRAVAAAGQTAPIQTWRDSSGTVLGQVLPNGTIEFPVGDTLAADVDLDAESAARVAADNILAAGLATEVTNRTNGDANNPSSGQKSALAGAFGTPGAANRYVTETDPRLIATLQNGVLASGDLGGPGNGGAIAITPGTGSLAVTPGPVGVGSFVKAASGLLVPFTGSPSVTGVPSLPASGKYAVIGVEMDTTGVLAFVKGADSSTQLNTGTLIAANSPAVTAGKMRIHDIAIWNNSGTYNFSDHTTAQSQGVNWIDRRPWARGAHSRQIGNALYNIASNTPTLIDATTLGVRIECSGLPVRLTFFCPDVTNTVPAPTNFSIAEDGAGMDGFPAPGGAFGGIGNGAMLETASISAQPVTLTWETVPSAGSHLFQPMWGAASGTSSISSQGGVDQTLFIVEEVVRQNATNGVK